MTIEVSEQRLLIKTVIYVVGIPTCLVFFSTTYIILGSDPGEFGEYFEGDMILDVKQKRAVSEAMDARNGLKGGAKRWPNRTVVYHINEDDFGSYGFKSKFE